MAGHRAVPDPAPEFMALAERVWTDLRNRPPCLPGFTHVIIRESDGVRVCQICGEVMR
jgi:hypothetical protein